jgi:hypothetical protein
VVLLKGITRATGSISFPSSFCQLPDVRRLAQPRLAESLAGRVVEKHLVFLAGPDGVGLQQAWPFKLEEQATRLPGTTDQCLLQLGLFSVESIVVAQPLMNVMA